MALITEEIPVKELRLYHKNPRIGNVEAIASSLRVNGQYRAIVVNKGTHTGRAMEVLAGNHTLKAARDLGWETITAHVLDVDEDQATRIVLADNRTAELGDMDYDILLEVMATLDDLDGTGYTNEDMVSDLDGLDEPLLVGDDELPDEVEQRSQEGDVWQLGDHIVVCGNSKKPEAYKALLGDDKADVVWTDPPYGVSYVGKTKDKLTIQNDGADQLEGLLTAAFPLVFNHCRPGAPIYVAHAEVERVAFEEAFIAAGFDFRQVLIWVKNAIVMGRSDYHYQHEPVLYGFKPAPKGSGRLGRGGDNWHGDDSASTIIEAAEDVTAMWAGEGEDRVLLVDPIRLQEAVEQVWDGSTVIYEDKPAASKEHPTMKPVGLVTQMLRNSATVGDIVLDVFGGSGTTLLAAEKMGLKARLIELDPRFVDVILGRWEEATGGTAVRIGSI